MSGVAVALTQAEFLWGVTAGGMRAERARRQNQEPTWYGEGREGLKTWLDRDVGSCLAEIAFAKLVNGYPLGLSGEKLPDVMAWDGPWEVRHTPEYRGDDRTHLIIRTRDLREDGDIGPDKRFALVSGTYREYVIRGWAWRDDVVAEQYRRVMKTDEPPSWWMPITDLSSLEGVLV